MKKSRKDFIIEAHKHACSEWKGKINKEFPELFKSSLEVGKWYNCEGRLFIYSGKKGNQTQIGFTVRGKWSMLGLQEDCEPTPANDKEVETALIKEAKKRGLVSGVSIKCPKYNSKHTLKNSGSNYVLLNDNEGYFLTYYGWRIFNNGKWATIIETITKEEAEKELGKTIVD